MAYKLFKSENYENWLWFLQKLKYVVDDHDVVIISSRHEALLQSVVEVLEKKTIISKRTLIAF